MSCFFILRLHLPWVTYHLVFILLSFSPECLVSRTSFKVWKLNLEVGQIWLSKKIIDKFGWNSKSPNGNSQKNAFYKHLGLYFDRHYILQCWRYNGYVNTYEAVKNELDFFATGTPESYCQRATLEKCKTVLHDHGANISYFPGCPPNKLCELIPRQWYSESLINLFDNKFIIKDVHIDTVSELRNNQKNSIHEKRPLFSCECNKK